MSHAIGEGRETSPQSLAEGMLGLVGHSGTKPEPTAEDFVKEVIAEVTSTDFDEQSMRNGLRIVLENTPRNITVSVHMRHVESPVDMGIGTDGGSIPASVIQYLEGEA